MKVLVVAGEQSARLLIKTQIKSISGISEILESDSVEDALFRILENGYRFIIVSDHFKGRNGLELAYLLQKIKYESWIILLSDDTDKAIDAIRAKVFDYLVYPFPPVKLIESVRKAIVAIKTTHKAEKRRVAKGDMKIRIYSHNGFVLVDLNMLSYCVADGSYTRLYFADGHDEYTSSNLGRLTKKLEDYHFIRISRSTLVNLSQVKSIDKIEGICYVVSGDKEVELTITKAYLLNLEAKNIL